MLRISTGTQYPLQNIYSENDWNGVYAIAEKQSIVGILLSALEIIHKNNNSMPSSMLLLQWIGMANVIEDNTNSLMEAGKTVILEIIQRTIR